MEDQGKKGEVVRLSFHKSLAELIDERGRWNGTYNMAKSNISLWERQIGEAEHDLATIERIAAREGREGTVDLRMVRRKQESQAKIPELNSKIALLRQKITEALELMRQAERNRKKVQEEIDRKQRQESKG